MKDYASKKSFLLDEAKASVSKEGRTQARRINASQERARVKSFSQPKISSNLAQKKKLRFYLMIGLSVVALVVMVAAVRSSGLPEWLHQKVLKIQSEKAARHKSELHNAADVDSQHASQAQPQTTPVKNTTSSSNSASDASVARPAPVDTTPAFDFYTVLPNRKLDAGAADHSNSPSTPVVVHQFMLQVGSYQDDDDAEKLKARLLLLGLSPAVSSSPGGWYRVELGPYGSVREGDVVRHKVQKAGINGAIIRQLN